MNFITKLFVENYIKNILPSAMEETLKEVKVKYSLLSLSKEDLTNLAIAQATNSVKVPWYLAPFKNSIINSLKPIIVAEVENKLK